MTLGPGCREFESRHSDHKSRKSICSLGFYLLNARLERSNRNMPVAYCCHQFKNWWLPLSAPFGADANESSHSDQTRQFSERELAGLSYITQSIRQFYLHLMHSCLDGVSSGIALFLYQCSMIALPFLSDLPLYIPNIYIGANKNPSCSHFDLLLPILPTASIPFHIATLTPWYKLNLICVVRHLPHSFAVKNTHWCI